jgi:hypothetical protein
MVKIKRAVVKFKKVTVIIAFVGDTCKVKYIEKKKPSASWKRLVSGHSRSKSGVRRWGR